MRRLSWFALLSLVACGEAVPEGEKIPQGQSAMPVAPPPPKPAPNPVADAAAEKEANEYFYNPAGKRDPFQGFLNRGGKGDDVMADAPPLQRWDVDRFVLKGVIWQTEAPRALLIDPDRTGHVVKMGSYVGRNWGKVTSISDSCIVVTEEYQTLDGELVVNPVTVCFNTGNTKGSLVKK